MSSCKSNIPLDDIIESVKSQLMPLFIAKDGGIGYSNTLNDPTFKGGLTLDEDAKDSLCRQLTSCVEEVLSGDIDDLQLVIDEFKSSINTRLDSMDSNLEARFSAITADVIDRIKTEQDNRIAAISGERESRIAADTANDGRIDNAITTLTQADTAERESRMESIRLEQQNRTSSLQAEIDNRIAGDSNEQQSRINGDFTERESRIATDNILANNINNLMGLLLDLAGRTSQPAVKPVSYEVVDNSVTLTMSDGETLSIPRSEFSDWLSSQPTELATDSELQQLANTVASANDLDAVETALEDLVDRVDAIPVADQTIPVGPDRVGRFSISFDPNTREMTLTNDSTNHGYTSVTEIPTRINYMSLINSTDDIFDAYTDDNYGVTVFNYGYNTQGTPQDNLSSVGALGWQDNNTSSGGGITIHSSGEAFQIVSDSDDNTGQQFAIRYISPILTNNNNRSSEWEWLLTSANIRRVMPELFDIGVVNKYAGTWTKITDYAGMRIDRIYLSRGQAENIGLSIQ